MKTNKYYPIYSLNYKESFWKENEHMLLISNFKSLYKKDRSKNKSKSSKLMWSIVFLEHSKSPYNELLYKDRLVIVNNEILSGESKLDPNNEEHKLLIDKFKNLCLTKAQRTALQWGKKLDERYEFIDSLEYNEETWEFLDKLMASTEKLWKQYQNCLKDMIEEESKSQVQGGALESLSESGEI